jgi:DNA protecting protein DprA
MIRLEPGDSRLPIRRAAALGLAPDADRRRPLWVSGSVAALGIPAVGIVGTRRPSSHGLAAARTLAQVAVAAGWAVVSGAALGIDAAAHESAVAAGGVTIAVLPSPAPAGLRRGARALAAQILVRGALVADRPPGTPPERWSFAARNALLAVLCDGVVVVEAPSGSGALITVEAAVERGVPTAIVTSPFGSASARGGWEWYQAEAELSVRYPERLPPTILADPANLYTWLSVGAPSVYADSGAPRLSGPRSVAPSPSTGLPPLLATEELVTEALWSPAPDSPRGRLLLALAAAGADGLAEGDLLVASEAGGASLPAALTLLALEGRIEQRAGRWRLVEGAVLRSRA